MPARARCERPRPPRVSKPFKSTTKAHAWPLPAPARTLATLLPPLPPQLHPSRSHSHQTRCIVAVVQRQPTSGFTKRRAARLRRRRMSTTSGMAGGRRGQRTRRVDGGVTPNLCRDRPRQRHHQREKRCAAHHWCAGRRFRGALPLHCRNGDRDVAVASDPVARPRSLGA